MSDVPAVIEPLQTYLLAIPDFVLYPGSFMPFQTNDPAVIQTVDAVFATDDRRLAVVPLGPPPDGADPAKPHALREVGVMAHVPRLRRLPDGSLHLLLHGQERVKVVQSDLAARPARATVTVSPVEPVESDTILVLSRNLKSIFERMSQLIPQVNEELVSTITAIDEPLPLVYYLATTVRMEAEERYQVLALDSLEDKLRLLQRVMQRELELLELGSRLQSEAAGEIDKAQREYFLRQQLKAIREELGESDDTTAEIEDLRRRLDEANLPEEADQTARRELRRLENLPPAAAEHNVIRTYLDLILDVPWHTMSEDNLDLRHAQRVLDEDHHGLDHVKDRLIEYLAVRGLKRDLRGPILCFVGPPGVGKTSLGQSIARALGRKFVRLSLGGVHDEAEIRGHRRTYIGAMPGRIIEHLRRCGVRNPVFMLDEVDKVTASLHGDPSSALLEVLDPAQNSTFRDNYLDLPFDLSQVLFIATANLVQTIQPALLDRLETIEIEGYTETEKLAIARRYLIPRQREEHGLTVEQFQITAPALRQVISGYTRESGVRNLERQVGTLARKGARAIAEGRREQVKVRLGDLPELLGPPPVHDEIAGRADHPGVVVGLSVTPTGGRVLYVEALRMPGKGQLRLTGKLGEVMKESAEAAFSFLKAHASDYGLNPADLETSDFHLHVPAGAIPKDGPSAGITITTALLSALTRQPVGAEVAMTGEVTLTGQVLPVGGIKEKLLAARRAGVKTVIIPYHNAPDLARVPAEVSDAMRIVTAETLADVFAVALPQAQANGRQPA